MYCHYFICFFFCALFCFVLLLFFDAFQGKKKGYSGQPSVGPFAGVEPWVYFNVGGDQVKRMLEEVRTPLTLTCLLLKSFWGQFRSANNTSSEPLPSLRVCPQNFGNMVYMLLLLLLISLLLLLLSSSLPLLRRILRKTWHTAHESAYGA